jgi:5-enolpyruvylshikimate-3-phosphate synthase
MQGRQLAHRTAVFAAVACVICAGACSQSSSKSSDGAAQARIGESLALLGCKISVADFRWSGDVVPVDIDAGDINDAVLYATVSVIGTHAAVWVTRD